MKVTLLASLALTAASARILSVFSVSDVADTIASFAHDEGNKEEEGQGRTKTLVWFEASAAAAAGKEGRKDPSKTMDTDLPSLAVDYWIPSALVMDDLMNEILFTNGKKLQQQQSLPILNLLESSSSEGRELFSSSILNEKMEVVTFLAPPSSENGDILETLNTFENTFTFNIYLIPRSVWLEYSGIILKAGSERGDGNMELLKLSTKALQSSSSAEEGEGEFQIYQDEQAKEDGGQALTASSKKRDGEKNGAGGRKFTTLPSTPLCPATMADCKTFTGNCSHHGFCSLQNYPTRVGVKCYFCSCNVTTWTDDFGNPVKNYKGPVIWTGGACEKQDVSISFNIVFWTVIGLFLAIVITVGMLYSIGEGESEGQAGSGIANREKQE